MVKDNETYRYEYFLKDHLGNTRVVFSDLNNDGSITIGGEENEILQETNYYPFGMSFAEQNINYSNKYLYNGKELQDEFGLDWFDYGARMYDAEISRWHSMDNLLEKYNGQSPYLYTGGNPIRFVDFDGNDYGVYVDNDNNTITIKATLYTTSSSMNSALQAANYWNEKTGEFEYQEIHDGQTYQIIFEITVVEVEIDPNMNELGSLNNARFNDNSGEANIYRVVDDSDLPENKNGTTTDLGTYVRVKNSKSNDLTGAHEVGHLLGVKHNTEGLMAPGADDFARSNKILKTDVRDILKYPRLGMVNEQTNPQGDPTKCGKGTVQSADIPRGKVKEREGERL